MWCATVVVHASSLLSGMHTSKAQTITAYCELHCALYDGLFLTCELVVHRSSTPQLVPHVQMSPAALTASRLLQIHQWLASCGLRLRTFAAR
jgi:hypothetical protein